MTDSAARSQQDARYRGMEAAQRARQGRPRASLPVPRWPLSRVASQALEDYVRTLAEERDNEPDSSSRELYDFAISLAMMRVDS